jgi:hypothetical protein
MTKSLVPGLGLLALLQTGCLVQITRVSNPGPMFRQARVEAERAAERRGAAHELNLLVFDADQRQLVRVALPMWLVRRASRHVDFEKDIAWDDVELPEGARSALKRNHRVRDLSLRELDKVPPGILAEVEEDDGTQVLVWLR